MAVKFSIFILLFSGVLCAEVVGETYILAKKGWEAPVGTRLQITSSREVTRGKMKVTSDGVWNTGRLSSLETQEIVGERSSADLYLLRFLKDTNQYRMSYDGEKTQSKDERPLHGEAVRVVRKEGEWTAALVDGDPAEKDADELMRQLQVIGANTHFDYSASLYGTESRKVGESWKVDLPLLPGIAKGVIQEGWAAVVFDEVGDLRGSQCAFLTLTFSVKVDFTEFEGGIVEWEGEGKVVRSLENFWDLKYESKGSLKAVKNSPGDESVTVEIEGQCQMTSEITILPAVEGNQ